MERLIIETHLPERLRNILSIAKPKMVLVYCLGIGQLIVAAFSLAQHFVSIIQFGKVEECIANYLDGGYMRCLWCIGQIVALIMALFSMLFMPKAHPIYLWPLLTIQNAYCFGLIILTIATADKLLTSILHPVNGHLILFIAVFFIGTSANHLFDYILWHYYWYQESEYIKRTGLPVVSFWV